MKNQKKGEHSFSIEMDSKNHLSHLSLTEKKEGVLIKGKLGELKEINHEEGLMVEIMGDHGTLRIDLTKDELDQMNKKKEAEK